MKWRWRCLAQEQELLEQLQLEQDALVVGGVDGLTARTFETLGKGRGINLFGLLKVILVQHACGALAITKASFPFFKVC